MKHLKTGLKTLIPYVRNNNPGLVVLCFIVLLTAWGCQHTGDDTDQVSPEHRAEVLPLHALFEAVKQADSTAMMSCFTPQATLTSTGNRGGAKILKRMTAAQFAHAAAGDTLRQWQEHIDILSVESDGDLAAITMLYIFALDGKPHHKGYQIALLVNTPQGWKIDYIMDNVSPQE